MPENVKKIKGQIPYRLYVRLKKDAETQGIRLSEYLQEIVERAVRGPDRYGSADVEHAISVRGESPNNVHFMAGPFLQQRFDTLKRMNKIENDSVAIRAILFRNYKKEEVTADCVQGTFF